MKILLTGSKGQLGRCFQDRFPDSWDILATDSDVLDITDVIVNAAAYTAVDKAEEESVLAEKINAKGPENLALAAKKYNSKFIHISTDYVFDGKSTVPYLETDITNPLGSYGKTKLRGEIAVLGALPEAIIIRTAWVFSEYGKNFVKTMLQLASTHDSLRIVSDQRGCPTYAGDLAQVIILLIHKGVGRGVYHFCGDKEVNWSDFAQAIFNEAIIQGLLIKGPSITRIASNEYPTSAQRPAYSSLNCNKIYEFGVSPSDWNQSLKKVIKLLS
jgi:dTDP-4-dehydrorhamnose reductase